MPLKVPGLAGHGDYVYGHVTGLLIAPHSTLRGELKVSLRGITSP
jgi:hypothetical protein